MKRSMDRSEPNADENRTIVAALYKFTRLPDHEAVRGPLLDACIAAQVKGTLLLASEGINGTVAGSRAGIDSVLSYIQNDIGLRDLEHKESFAQGNPFYRMKVRLKKEIVTMGVDNIDPNRSVGTYVDPKDWNELITDPDVVVIDTRNDYEVGIGSFKNAIDPKTETFRDFPAWFENQSDLQPEALKGKKVAMFCTGGIRCEKATAFVKQNGIDDVFHLKGGILKYLETVPERESLWEGECFVFDQRVSVKHGLALGSYEQCHACRRPITEEDKSSPHYVPGVSCPHCFGSVADDKKQRLAERQKQVELAERRGEVHLGKQFKTKRSPRHSS